MKKYILIIIFITTNYTIAQMPKLQGRIDNLRKVTIIDELNLDETKSAMYLAVENKYRNELKDNEIKIRESVDKLDLQLKTNVSENELQKTITQIEDLEKLKFSNKMNYLKELKSNLNNKEFAQYILIERNFNNEMKNRFKKMLKQPMNR